MFRVKAEPARIIHELLDWHIRFSVRGMEGDFLSGGFVREQNAGVLLGAFHDDGSELHLSPDPEPEDDPELVGGNAGAFQVQFESAAEGDAFREAEKLRRYDALLLPGYLRSRSEARTGPVPATTEFQEGHRGGGRFSRRCSRGIASRL